MRSRAARKAGVDPALVGQALLDGFAASRVLEVQPRHLDARPARCQGELDMMVVPGRGRSGGEP